MPVQILHDQARQVACMYSDTTDEAFGPVFAGEHCEVVLGQFIEALPDHPNAFRPDRLVEMAQAFVQMINNDVSDFDTRAGAPTDEPPAPQPADRDAVSFDEPTAPGVAVDTPSDVPDNEPNVGPHPPDTSTGGDTTEPDAFARADAAKTDDRPPAPAGATQCWNCRGRMYEPGTSGTICGICSGNGWLPA